MLLRPEVMSNHHHYHHPHPHHRAEAVRTAIQTRTGVQTPPRSNTSARHTQVKMCISLDRTPLRVCNGARLLRTRLGLAADTPASPRARAVHKAPLARGPSIMRSPSLRTSPCPVLVEQAAALVSPSTSLCSPPVRVWLRRTRVVLRADMTLHLSPSPPGARVEVLDQKLVSSYNTRAWSRAE